MRGRLRAVDWLQTTVLVALLALLLIFRDSRLTSPDGPWGVVPILGIGIWWGWVQSTVREQRREIEALKQRYSARDVIAARTRGI